MSSPVTGAGPLPWTEQIALGALVCPETRATLEIAPDGRSLRSRGGDRVYPLVAGSIPFLAPDPERIRKYLADSEMKDRYGTIEGQAPDPYPARPPGIRGWMEGLIEADFRSPASSAAFAKVFAESRGKLLLSIGGGPHRDHPAFVNLNLGPFPNVEIIADAHKLPYADASVDGIYCSAVMEHLYDPPKAVAEMLRVLKPGGKAYLRTPFLQPYHGYPHHYQNFTLTGHVRIFAAAGFTVEESGTDVGPSYVLIHMIQTYVQTYFPWAWIKPVRILWTLVAHGAFKRIDRVLNARAESHEMASTTYLVARKP